MSAQGLCWGLHVLFAAAAGALIASWHVLLDGDVAGEPSLPFLEGQAALLTLLPCELPAGALFWISSYLSQANST